MNMADETRAALDTIPEMTVKRDAHGLTIDVAGKRESIVLDYWPGDGVRLFVFDDCGNEMRPEYTLTDADPDPDDCDRSGELANVPGGPGCPALDAPARSVPFVFRVDVPVGCRITDSELVAALNLAINRGLWSLDKNPEYGINTNAADAKIGRANAIDLDGDLLATAARFRRADYVPGSVGVLQQTQDMEKLAKAFLGIL